MKISTNTEFEHAFMEQNIRNITISFHNDEVKQNDRLQKILNLLEKEVSEQQRIQKIQMFENSEEYKKCRKDFIYFLERYVFEGNMLIPTLKYKQLLRELSNYSNISIYQKTRGIGSTTLLVAYSIWKLLFWNENTFFYLHNMEKCKHYRDLCNTIENKIRNSFLLNFELEMECTPYSISFNNCSIKFMSVDPNNIYGKRYPDNSNVIIVGNIQTFLLNNMEEFVDRIYLNIVNEKCRIISLNCEFHVDSVSYVI